jgi:naphthalene 1,2-dioxygenase system ferredoxin subunit
MADWIKVMPADEIPSDDVLAVTIDGREFAIYGVEGEIFATDVMCTHGDARLCDGFLIGHEIECPFHQGRFDVRSGQATFGPACEPIKTYGTKVKDGVLWLWPEADN